MRYYKKVGISAVGFKCKYYKECRSECEDTSKFTTAREPYIGKHYSKKGVPRLLFLSLDSGDEVTDPQSKTIKALRERSWVPKNKEKPKHWYKTHQFACVIFDELNKISQSKWDSGNVDKNMDFHPVQEIEKIKSFFAHTNSAKCCMNNKHAKQASKTLFNNCRSYIPEELKIFDPHILVTQGNFARETVEAAVGEGIFSLKKRRNISKASKKHDFMIIEIKRNKPALWIHHYHPGNWGTFLKKIYPRYRNYAKETAQFIAKNYPEFTQHKSK